MSSRVFPLILLTALLLLPARSSEAWTNLSVIGELGAGYDSNFYFMPPDFDETPSLPLRTLAGAGLTHAPNLRWQARSYLLAGHDRFLAGDAGGTANSLDGGMSVRFRPDLWSSLDLDVFAVRTVGTEDISALTSTVGGANLAWSYFFERFTLGAVARFDHVRFNGGDNVEDRADRYLTTGATLGFDAAGWWKGGLYWLASWSNAAGVAYTGPRMNLEYQRELWYGFIAEALLEYRRRRYDEGRQDWRARGGIGLSRALSEWSDSALRINHARNYSNLDAFSYRWTTIEWRVSVYPYWGL